jgi:NAD(P)-dependent dehydrogenase (short-subunit alcohol dehydrogenase family)
MRIVLVGSTGGIGSAIKQALMEHEFVDAGKDIDWLICAQGYIGEFDIQETFSTNTILCMEYTRNFLPFLKKGVIYISSAAGIKGNSAYPAYAASKAAVNIYSKSMAKAYSELQFYSICPGPTNTKMWRGLGLPGKPQDPSEVAKVVKMAMEGNFRSGAIISVRDGVVAI